MLTDLSEAQLWEYRSAQPMPDDFDEFWASTISEAREVPASAQLHRVETGLTTLAHFDLAYPGFGGQTVRGWVVRPVGGTGPLPVVVQYVGYNGGRGTPLENLLWASAGYVHVVMDTRGQGSSHRRGATSDIGWSGPAFPGFLTRGVEDRREYYYRRLITDAVRAIDVALGLEGVDTRSIFTVGGSQGGLLSLAASALHESVAASVSFVPFLCDVRRASLITDADPYKEIGRYLEVHQDKVQQTFDTLAYFDGVNFARRARVPSLFSTSLMDATCPPSTVFGMFHEYAGPKRIAVWPYNGHTGGGIEDERIAMEWLAEPRGAPR